MVREPWACLGVPSEFGTLRKHGTCWDQSHAAAFNSASLPEQTFSTYTSATSIMDCRRLSLPPLPWLLFICSHMHRLGPVLYLFFLDVRHVETCREALAASSSLREMPNLNL